MAVKTADPEVEVTPEERAEALERVTAGAVEDIRTERRHVKEQAEQEENRKKQAKQVLAAAKEAVQVRATLIIEFDKLLRTLRATATELIAARELHRQCVARAAKLGVEIAPWPTPPYGLVGQGDERELLRTALTMAAQVGGRV